MTYYTKSKSIKDSKLVLTIVSLLALLFLIVCLHHGLWQYYYSVNNPEWNRTKCADMAYEHFLDLTKWP
jgi:hypothetical protein